MLQFLCCYHPADSGRAAWESGNHGTPGGSVGHAAIPARPGGLFSRDSGTTISDARFAAMSARKKIDTLMGMRNKLAAMQAQSGTAQVGQRRLTASGCARFALEIGLQSDWKQVPAISRALLMDAGSAEQNFPVFGTNFKRERIEAWARSENLPGGKKALPEIAAKDAAMMKMKHASPYERSENVSNESVLAAGNAQLRKIQSRVSPSALKTLAQTEREIRNYLYTMRLLPFSSRAVDGLNWVMAATRDERTPRVGGSLSNTLALLWTYIEHSENQLHQQLRESMTNKLKEIASEQPCPSGIAQRLIDIPTSIDWSVTDENSSEHLKYELARMAAETNEEFERDHAQTCAQVRENARQSYPPGNPDATISALKRDLFLEKARIEFSVIRGLKAEAVRAEAEKVFPRGTIL
jgi:hypothetical protein